MKWVTLHNERMATIMTIAGSGGTLVTMALAWFAFEDSDFRIVLMLVLAAAYASVWFTVVMPMLRMTAVAVNTGAGKFRIGKTEYSFNDFSKMYIVHEKLEHNSTPAKYLEINTNNGGVGRLFPQNFSSQQKSAYKAMLNKAKNFEEPDTVTTEFPLPTRAQLTLEQAHEFGQKFPI